MLVNIGINGFGRIGRVIFRTCVDNDGLEVSAINDPAIDTDYICYLIKFDSTHGKFKGDVSITNNEITVNGKLIKVFHERLPSSIPWQTAEVHYVIEASGIFTNLEKASGHLNADTVKRVIVTAPSLDVPMLILGVNEQDVTREHKVISCASSTLYCLAPIIKILEQNYGVSEGFITSIHAMTPSLKPLDGLCLRGKHWRDHRSIHQNIIPAATGACKALNKIIPQIKDKMNGIAFRVPIVNVSVLDITIRLNKNTTIEDIIKRINIESETNMKNIIKTCNDEAVSSDFIGDVNSCILDIKSSLQLTANFFKLICWYENEYSYACRVIDTIKFCEKKFCVDLKSLNYNRLLSRRLFHEQSVPYFCKQTYDNRNQKTLSGSSQDINSKPNKQIIIQKPLPIRTSLRDSKRNDIYKVWNDDVKIDLPRAQDNKTSLLHTCFTLGPCKCQNYIQNQERLQKVKQDVSKMMDMTENLLKNTNQVSKLENDDMKILKTDNISNISSNDCNFSANQIYKDIFKTNIKENDLQMNDEDNVEKHDERKINGPPIEITESKKSIVQEKTSLANQLQEFSQNILKRDFPIKFSERKKYLCVEKTNIHYCEDVNIKTQENINHIPYSTEANNVETNNICQGIINRQYHGETIDKCDIETSNQSRKSSYKNENHEEEQEGLHDKSMNVLENNNSEKNTLDNEKIQNADISKTKDITEEYDSIHELDQPTTPEKSIELESLDSDEMDKKKAKRKIIKNIIKKLSVEKIYSPVKTSISANLYDKIDSASDTDSENSFHMKEKKSQVIHLSDLTSSIEDLSRLDKICRIIEISDELSDNLFSALEASNPDLKNKKWSFKDLCDKLKLDEFYNKVFGKEEKIM